MIWGYTGTQYGMAEPQLASYRWLLRNGIGGITPDGIIHGDCDGGDKEAHHAALAARVPVTEIWPPDKDAKRAFCRGAGYVAEPMPYVARDRRIVQRSGLVTAAPRHLRWVPHSGTWFTAGYALETGKETWVIWRDGRIQQISRTELREARRSRTGMPADGSQGTVLTP